MGLKHWPGKTEPHFGSVAELGEKQSVSATEDSKASRSAATRATVFQEDGMGSNRTVILFWIAMLPTMFWGVWNLGYQANTWLALHPDMLAAQTDWRYFFIRMFAGHDSTSLWDNVVHGALYFVPVYMVSFVVSGCWAIQFAMRRRQKINTGFIVTSVVFALSLPPAIPLWQVALGVLFGAVLANEVLAGTATRMIFVNPTLAGLAFLFYCFPAQMSGDSVWTAVDGFSGATALSLAKQGGVDAITGTGLGWWDFFLGKSQGSVGEVSTLCILLGASLLLATRAASWRIMVGVILGVVGMALIFNVVGSATNPMFSMPWHWHLVLGGMAFGTVFIATDPASACLTDRGRLIFGVLIGVMVVLIRVVNPAYPEGIMLAILFANLFAGIIDIFVVLTHRDHKLATGDGGK